jgi:hypothetical protein
MTKRKLPAISDVDELRILPEECRRSEHQNNRNER